MAYEYTVLIKGQIAPNEWLPIFKGGARSSKKT